MGQGCLKEKGTQEPIGKRAHGSDKSLRKEYVAGPKGGLAGLSHYSRNDRTQRQNMMASKKWAGRNVKPNIKRSPAPEVGRECTTDRVSKPPGRSRRMSGRQILDIRGGRARMKPRHHQPIPSQYGTWWGHGSEVRGYGLVVGRGEETYFWGSCPSSFGRCVLLGWQTTQKRQG